MQFILLGLALLVAVLLIGRAFASADPKKLAHNTRQLTGWGALLTAIVLALRGAFVIAAPLAFFAFTILGFSTPWNRGAGQSRKSQGQRSSVRTELLDMALDHDTGEMEGRVKKGRFEGRSLSSLAPAELDALLEEARQTDLQAAQLLEAYIERTAGGSRSGRKSSARQGSNTMTLAEAYAVLGLRAGASHEDIHQAHRALMKKFHPDQGGTDYMASKINEAKDILLQHVRD